jgi:hypothetical protein
MLDNTEGTITNGQSRETSNKEYTRRRKTNHNSINTMRFQHVYKYINVYSFTFFIYFIQLLISSGWQKSNIDIPTISCGKYPNNGIVL